ncbi:MULTISPECIES: hypothetical protein [Pseudonocardia]|uniref:Uncharacterized protein n=2 Tax=Pseudonocardia TaxID=1847 RepID=A0A1Y2MPX3_PSEAH|nr:MULTISPECIES: hypothetical protein [Pseudonocardia]OSY37284.1 hypothetical protein BG845_04795 [Pseudonocardia autotrophica]TDN72419.1 hypothetical protein C8E95_1476 [Pseudonocardia autotrophica]BBG03128.1 hypothetical protein Pdca_43370 [Pseudonocardia autotrophica]GEC23747.1 hypothetical protein PSA01_07760 [Pseudonocardia saturnea]
MIVDCDRCQVRDTACGDCVIGVLMDVPEIDRPIPYLPVDLPGTLPRLEQPGPPASAPLEFSEPERRALQVLAEQGLIPHLRLVEAGAGRVEQPARPMLPIPVVPPRQRDVG